MSKKLSDFIECAQKIEGTFDEIAAIAGDPSLAHDHEKLIRRLSGLVAESIGEPELADDVNALAERMAACNAHIKEVESQRERLRRHRRLRQSQNHRRTARKELSLTKGLKGHEAA